MMLSVKKIRLLGLVLFAVATAFLLRATLFATKQRIAMVTVSTPNRISFSQYTLGSFKRYAEKWGYDLIVHKATLDASRPVQWSKIKAVQNLLQTNQYDWVVWVDDDIFITNPEQSFDQVIAQQRDHTEFIISAHKEKLPEFNDVNSGLFLAKNTQWVKGFLDRVWAIGYDRYNKEMGSFWEQSAMQELLEAAEFKHDPHIKILPARNIQSFITLLHKGDKGDYGQWRPGDFAAHLAGAGEYVRVLITQQFSKDSKKYPFLGQFAQHFTIQQV